MRVPGTTTSTSTTATTATAPAGAGEPVRLTADELKKLYREKVHPAVRESMAKAGRSVNFSNCEMAAGMTKYALDKLGVDGAKIVAGKGHAFVEVRTKDGKSVILDPTSAQFTGDSHPLDAKLRKEGFAGTRRELRDMVANNMPAFGRGAPHPAFLDTYNGKHVSGYDRRDLAVGHNELAAESKAVADRWEPDPKTHLDRTARKELDWARGDRSKPLMLGTRDEETGARVTKDRSTTFRLAYDSLDKVVVRP